MENDVRKFQEIMGGKLPKKEQDYQRLSSDIIDAVEAKIKETGKHKFRTNSSCGLIGSEAIATCFLGLKMNPIPTRTLRIIEEPVSPDYDAKRGIITIEESYMEAPLFVYFVEKVASGGEAEEEIHVDASNNNFDQRPWMLNFLESIRKWEPVA